MRKDEAMTAWAARSFDFNGSPVDVLECFRDRPYPFLLESSLFHDERGRYSFVGCDPRRVVRGPGPEGLAALREPVFRMDLNQALPATPFPSGWVGFLSYDHGSRQEGICPRPDPGASFPDYCFGFYEGVITIDYALRKLHVISCGPQARQRLAQTLGLLNQIKPRDRRIPGAFSYDLVSAPPSLSLTSNFTRGAYLDTVRRAQDHIRSGNIYQVNLSQRFTLDPKDPIRAVDPLRLYRWLRWFSPSCFAGYFDGGTFQILSSSPERLVQLQQGRVVTRPMKGTRPRGVSPPEDRQKRLELLQSEKDRAELLMITDLERNDLGRVCEYGSVRVRELRTIEDYQTVFQATSTIEGSLREDKDALDLLAATFPGGSVTGCPKIRAMQIIHELEPVPRGIYTGSLGYLSVTGDMDFNILIRTLVRDREKIRFHVGGGIVADSVPEQEYQETLDKARAMSWSLAAVLSPGRIPVSPDPGREALAVSQER